VPEPRPRKRRRILEALALAYRLHLHGHFATFLERSRPKGVRTYRHAAIVPVDQEVSVEVGIHAS
jgi:hypothetical protein